MKHPLKTISLLTASALFSLSSLTAVETDPVGYVTETLKAGSFSVIAANLVTPVVASGVIDESTTSSVTDSDASFSTLLQPDESYFILLKGAGATGINTGVAAQSGSVLETGADLSSLITDGVTNYEVRRLLTVEDLFGASNEAELKGAQQGDFESADIVWVPDGSGGFDKIYFNETERTGFGAISVGWKFTDGGDTDASDTPVYFSSGLLVEVKRTSFDPSEKGFDPEDSTKKKVVFSGSVMNSDVEAPVVTGFNYIGRVFPSTMTLSQSLLANELVTAEQGDFDSADLVWIPDGEGGYTKYYYNATERTGFGALSVGWKSTTGGNTDASDVNLTSGFIIERRGADAMVTLPTLLN